MNDFISIAKVLKPQGIKGELKCKVLTEKLDIFGSLTHLFCDKKEIKVVSSVHRLGYAYIKLENVVSRNDAENFRNKTFFLDRESYGKLKEDNYFIEDLVGCEIFDDKNNKIGMVDDIENYGATDIVIVQEEWAKYSVPFLKKIFKKIIPENKKIIIDLEEYNNNKMY